LHFNAINISGQKFGRLTAIEPTDKRNGSNVIWKCLCDCGKIVYVNTVNIKNTTNSCGCLRKEILLNRTNQKNPNYKYGKKESKQREKLKRLYGLTLEEYNTKLKKQKSVCLICEKKDRKTLSVDHNHKTKKVRGLLCQKCNTGIGMFQDNIKLLKQAIKYLRNYNEITSR